MAKKPTPAGLVRVGQLDLLVDIARDIAPPTRPQQKLIEAGELIAQQPDSVDLAYLARELVQCTLPHSDPGDVPLWTRTNGNVTLVMARLGLDEKTLKPIGYPYGSLPRLLLFWMNTEAVQTGKRRLELGDTFTDFIRQLGLDPSRGGVRSDAKRLRDQMTRLFSAAIGFQGIGQDGDARSLRHRKLNVAEDSELWWDPKAPNQVALWGSWVELGEKFFDYITKAPVPSDMRALRALKRSPLALDLYCWATHKALSVSTKGKSQFVPWIGLQRQFGTDYSSTKNFRQKAIAALKKIEAVYPGLKLEDAEGGIVVHSSSQPAVPYKPSRRIPIESDR
jgi:Plasmid encoded RepA protein